MQPVRLPVVTDAVNEIALKNDASTHESNEMPPPAYWPAETVKLRRRLRAVVSTATVLADGAVPAYA